MGEFHFMMPFCFFCPCGLDSKLFSRAWAKSHFAQECLHFHTNFFGEFQLSSRCLAGPLAASSYTRLVEQGCLTKALLAVNPGRKRGPWRITCDNESFWFAPDSAKAHKQAHVKLLRIPPKAPDLNPVGRFWSWVRRGLARMDLDDLVKERPVPGKVAYKERARRLLKSPKAQTVASNMYYGLQKTARAVKKRGGKASTKG